MGLKRARSIVATHYDLDTRIAARKLLRHFTPSCENRRQAIINEARRIVALQDQLSFTENRCTMCGRQDRKHFCEMRNDIMLQTPKVLVQRGWRAYGIEPQVLCLHCWRIAAVFIADYKYLISTDKLARQLLRTTPDER